MNVRHPEGVLHSFSNKNIFYDKIDLRLFYFDVTILFQEEFCCSTMSFTFNVKGSWKN